MLCMDRGVGFIFVCACAQRRRVPLYMVLMLYYQRHQPTLLLSTVIQAALDESTAKVAELTAKLQAASATAEDVKALRQRAQLVEEELADATTKLEVQHKVGEGAGVVCHVESVP